jgi:hypothetical protein
MKNNLLLDRSRIESIPPSPASGALQHGLWPRAGWPGRGAVLAFVCLTATLLARPCLATPDGWDFTNSLNVGRFSHTATLLPDGMVLVAGGSDSLSSAELYNPATTVWSTTSSLATGRYDHSATLLPNGMVLAAGGIGPGFVNLTSAELYDPATGAWSPTGSMQNARLIHTATLLQNGMVLVAGGATSSSYLSSAELYNPAAGTWSTTGTLHTARGNHTATLLPDGKVLVAGGYNLTDTDTKSVELYDPATGTWTTTGSLNTGRSRHTATLLPNGLVLVAGGEGSNGTIDLTSAELYDPATGVWTFTGSLHTAREYHTATLLPNGQVLAAAGGFPTSTSAERYDPATGAWSITGSLNQARNRHTATLLPDGTVLAAGGTTGVTGLASAELYGSPVEIPANVQGRGTFDNLGNEVTFMFQASQSSDRFLGHLAFCDDAAGFCTKRGRVESLTITGNSAAFSGYVQLHGERITFDASVTGNSGSDTISINFSNGYSASGTLTSGEIRIY